VHIHAPYTHMPFHQRLDSGDVRFVNNDHCLLSMRAALQLKKLVSAEHAFLPMAQTIWYIPTGLDPWNQLLGHAPGHYNRVYNMEFSGKPTDPVAHWADSAPIDSNASLQERLDHWLTLVMRCQVDEAYQTFLGILKEYPAQREQVLAQLMFAGLIDVQDRTVFRQSFTTGHRSYRARATIELAETVGWENAHDVLYAGVLDLGVGLHWYSMYEMACAYSRIVLQGQDVEMQAVSKTGNINGPSEQEQALLTGDRGSAGERLGQIGTGPGLAKVLDRLGLGDAPSPGQAASGIEFVLEGLHLTRRLAKELTDDGRTLYGS